MIDILLERGINSLQGSCPYYLAPSRGEVEATVGPHNGDTENPIMSTPTPI